MSAECEECGADLAYDGTCQRCKDKARVAELEAENERLKASWDGLRREVAAYEKSGIDLYERANGKAFRKMMDRWAERGAL